VAGLAFEALAVHDANDIENRNSGMAVVIFILQ